LVGSKVGAWCSLLPIAALLSSSTLAEGRQPVNLAQDEPN
jgi:hypothetical protein